MATIRDTLRDGRGIRILDTQLDSSSSLAGRYDLLYHSNGIIYIAFARNNMTRPDANQTTDRQIWAAYSIDGGTTFSTPVQISNRNGSWHDNPCLCQIDPEDMNSPIGLVYTAAAKWSDSNTYKNTYNYPYRTMLDTALNRISPIDIITNYVSNNYSLTLFRANNRFVLIGINDLDSLTIYENIIVGPNAADGFLDNAWTHRTVNNFIAGDNKLQSIRVRPLKNGHLALVGAVAQATKGNIPRCNLGISFSADDGYTWTAFQYITNYTGTPALDLTGIVQCLDADVAEIGDNQLAIVYQEGRPAQTMDYYSDPQFSIWYSRTAEYHAAKNTLFIPVDTSGPEQGLYVYDLTTQTFTFRFTASSTPPIWSARVSRISISTDGKYLAAATESSAVSGGSLDVWDISAASPSDWTVVTSLRKTTTPALLASNVGWCKFIDEKTLLFSYLNDSGTTVWGGKVDITNIAAGITNLASPAPRSLSSTTGTPHVDIAGGVIHVAGSGYFWVTRISDGACLRSYHFVTGTPSIVTYDAVNDEWLAPDGNLYRLSDNGTTISLIDSITLTSDPMLPLSLLGGTCFPDTGQLLYVKSNTLWYDHFSRKIMGPILNQTERDTLGFGMSENQPSMGSLLKDGDWIGTVNSRGLHLQYIKATGKLRWGVFSYNPTTKLLDVNSSDLYALCDTNWVPTSDADHLVKPRICAAPMGNVCLTAFRYFPTRGGARPLALVTGVMNLEHRQLGMRAAIAKRTANPPTTQIKARIGKRTTATLGVLAQIHAARCLKMRAWIIPEQTQTLQMRAAILNKKSAHWGGAFDVVFTGRTRKLRLQFTVNTGYTGLGTCSIKARITQIGRKRFTGHFLVGANPDDSGSFSCQSVKLSYLNILGMRACLVSNR